MRALFDVTHPAHVHLFKHAIAELDRDGHDVRVLSREKEVTTALLDAAEIEHRPLSRKGGSPLALAREWLGRELRVLGEVLRFDPDLVVSRLNPAAVHAARLTDTPSIVFHDTEPADKLASWTLPFADVVCTPAAFEERWSGQRRYQGYQELAYLHPSRFDPDPEALREDGVAVDDRYSVIRLVAGDAHHDYGNDSLPTDVRARVVDALSELGPVYASVEADGEAPAGTEPLPVPPERLHDLLAFADCYVGDSNTTAVEAGLLGTPALRYDTFGAGALQNFVELESEYGLVRSTGDGHRLLELVNGVARQPDAAAARWREARNRLLADKVDVTGYMLDLLELEVRR
ncbi:DUF354 domain-containing protein [Haloarchaeobius salinus]|uniref:DUF354 domain-containing protein n=1 Tax=Haloarchaeobius salinus TaxID=1198298 RepID=UPI00210AAB54|nr:DUF354 domain-containing protein [Haloarchaeobius salinus]